MSGLLKAALMALGAGGVLLLAGAFPVDGVPAVYRSGLVRVLGLVLGLLCLCGAWRLSSGARVRLLCGAVCAFLACAGVAAVWCFGEMSLVFTGRNAAEPAGAGAYFGVLGFVCMGLVGLLFAAIFGFLTLRLLSKRLWLAGLHGWLALLLAGAFVDFRAEVAAPLRLAVGAAGVELPPVGSQAGLTLRVKDFKTLRYEGAAGYALLRHEGGRWVPAEAVPELRGDEVVLGAERWPLAALQKEPQSGQRYLMLPGNPARLLLEQPTPVREFSALCSLRLHRPGGDELREATLRVNEPLSCEGYRIYLMSYTPGASAAAPTVVDLLVRTAPGRRLALVAMLGVILCTVGWSFAPAAPRLSPPDSQA